MANRSERPKLREIKAKTVYLLEDIWSLNNITENPCKGNAQWTKEQVLVLCVCLLDCWRPSSELTRIITPNKGTVDKSLWRCIINFVNWCLKVYDFVPTLNTRPLLLLKWTLNTILHSAVVQRYLELIQQQFIWSQIAILSGALMIQDATFTG